MKRQHCINCIFSSWYHDFKDITLQSKIIKLPVEFVTYLTTDGIVLPDDDPIKYANDVERYSDTDDDDVGWNDDVTSETSSVPCFPELKRKVENAIHELGGVVFPKLNWSSPKDASWISHNGTLKCTSFNDVCLLLKSSDFVTNDLTNAYKFCKDDASAHPCDQFELVLREHETIMPGMEFRCFVKNNKLIGLTQRHVTTHFDYLQKNKNKILESLVNFFNSKIKGKFSDSTFVFDVHVGPNNRIVLIDFNPFGEITDSMLFTWDELTATSSESVDNSHEDFFRIVTESNNIQPSPFMRYAIPKDVVDLACGEDINKMIDFLRVRDLIAKPQDKVDEELPGN